MMAQNGVGIDIAIFNWLI